MGLALEDFLNGMHCEGLARILLLVYLEETENEAQKASSLGLVSWASAPRTGFEPVTYRLTAGRSTVELSRNVLSCNACSIHEVIVIRQYFFLRTRSPE